VKGRRGVIVGAVMICAILIAFAASYSWAQPGQWRVINPIFADLNDVWMTSSSSGWAVGEQGRAIYWDGNRWSEVLTPFTGDPTISLQSVSCLSATRCLAVGFDTAPVDAVLIQWDGIGWVDRSVLLPAGTTGLLGIFVRSDGLTFAVGDGTPNIIRIPDANLVPVAPVADFTADTPPLGPGPDTLRSVWLLPPGSGGAGVFGFAVGNPSGGAAGTTWRWDGSAGGWNFENPGVIPVTLRSVYVLSQASALAVGDGDIRTRWNGATWTVEGGVVIGGAVWRSTFMVSSGDQWMVGDVAAPNIYASIARWNGVSWAAFAAPNVPVTADLNSIYMLSSSDGWAVGDGGTIIRWNGSNWNSVGSPVASPNDIRGVWLAASADGWAVGDAGRILRWNGANWNFYQTAPVAAQLNEIHGTASTNVFAVGNDPDGAGGQPPVIIRWTGAAWTSISPAGVADNVDLHGVFLVSPSLAFAVGDAPPAAAATMLRWDGTLWASIASGTVVGVSLRSVWMVSATDGWAVGDGGTIVRWNGVAWAAETSPPATPTLNGVQALTSTDVWAVGNDGSIIHRDGTGWSTVPSGLVAGEHLNSLYMISSVEGWAVGIDVAGGDGSPFILFWNGLTWSRVLPIPAPPRAGAVNDNLEDVWMVASQDGWAVGQDGLILRFGPIQGVTVTTGTVTATATSTTTQQATATSTVTTSTVSTQVTSTQTSTGTTTTYSTVTSTTTVTPMPAPIPGFPIESILAGLFAGAAGLFVFRRRRRT